MDMPRGGGWSHQAEAHLPRASCRRKQRRSAGTSTGPWELIRFEPLEPQVELPSDCTEIATGVSANGEFL
jgi:hypothetical protein